MNDDKTGVGCWYNTINYNTINYNADMVSHKPYIRQSFIWDEKEYPSYFKSSFTDNAANSGMSSVLTELERAVHMKKDDWKREEL